MVWIVLDLVGAFLVYEISKMYHPKAPKITPIVPEKFENTLLDTAPEKKPKVTRKEPDYVPLVYLLSPYSIISCLMQSINTFTNVLVLLAVYLSMKKRPFGAMFCLAYAGYTLVYPAYYIAGCLLLLVPEKRPSKILQYFVYFGACVAALFGASYLMMSSWSFLDIYKTIILNEEGSITTSLHWYISLEMFAQFKHFFPIVFFILSMLFLVPYMVRYNDGIWICTMVSLLISVLTPSSVGDFAMMVTFIILCQSKGLVRQDVILFLGVHFAIVVLVGMISEGGMNGGKINIVYGVGLALKVIEILITGILMKNYGTKTGRLQFILQ